MIFKLFIIVRVGEVMHTKAGNLKVKYIIHAVIPFWTGVKHIKAIL